MKYEGIYGKKEKKLQMVIPESTRPALATTGLLSQRKPAKTLSSCYLSPLKISLKPYQNHPCLLSRLSFFKFFPLLLFTARPLEKPPSVSAIPTLQFLHQLAWLPPTTFMGSHALGQLSMRLSFMGPSPLPSTNVMKRGKKKILPDPPLLQKGSTTTL